MTTIQMQLNSELFGALQYISQDEGLMRKAVKALNRIVEKAKMADSARMTKEEFLAKLDKGEKEYKQGRYYEMMPGENLEDFLKRVE